MLQGPDAMTAQPGLVIAATALEYGLTIVSRNTTDYERARVPVLNPWIAEQQVQSHGR
jgi:hypothetical protein